MFNVNFDIKGVEKLIDSLKKDLKSVKGARAGYIKDQSYPNGLKIAENALIQEYGTEKIPARPFLRKTLKKQGKWVKFVNENFDANQESPMKLKQIAANIGLMMQTDIQESIDSNIPPPNAESTIKKKGSTKTLIDTGTLRNSVQYEVIKK